MPEQVCRPDVTEIGESSESNSVKKTAHMDSIGEASNASMLPKPVSFTYLILTATHQRAFNPYRETGKLTSSTTGSISAIGFLRITKTALLRMKRRRRMLTAAIHRTRIMTRVLMRTAKMTFLWRAANTHLKIYERGVQLCRKCATASCGTVQRTRLHCHRNRHCLLARGNLKMLRRGISSSSRWCLHCIFLFCICTGAQSCNTFLGCFFF